MQHSASAIVGGEVGPSPLVRAVVGLVLGAAVGALAALLLPRRKRADPDPHPVAAAEPELR